MGSDRVSVTFSVRMGARMCATVPYNTTLLYVGINLMFTSQSEALFTRTSEIDKGGQPGSYFLSLTTHAQWYSANFQPRF
jgi:hypothetical protein